MRRNVHLHVELSIAIPLRHCHACPCCYLEPNERTCGAQKEIHEQPDSLLQTMSGRVNLIGSHKVSL